jgi:hypothetical protein
VELRIIEQARFGGLDEDDSNLLTASYAELAQVRGQSGQSLLVDGTGRALTPAAFHEEHVALSAAGPVARVRRLTQEALGNPPGADYVVVHSVSLYAEQIEPWTSLAVTYRAQPVVGATELDEDAAPRAALFHAGPIALSADGQVLALLEFRGRGGGNGNPYQLIIEDVASGRRLAAYELPVGEAWDLTQLSFSPTGDWVLISPESNPGGPLLVAWGRGESVRLPTWLDSVAWNPSAGPGHLIATRIHEGHLAVGDYDLTSATWLPIRIPSGKLEHADYFTSLSVTPDGSMIAGIAPLADHERVTPGGGTGGHAMVLDLRAWTARRVLPRTFPNGVERDHQSVTWAQPHGAGPGFSLAAQLQKALTEARASAPLTVGQQESHVTRYQTTMRDLILAAAEGRAPIRLVGPQLQALAASAISIDTGLVDAARAVAQNVVDREQPRADVAEWSHLLDYLRALLAGDEPQLGLRPATVSGAATSSGAHGSTASREPNEYIAAQVLVLAKRRSQPVEGKTIMEVFTQGLLEPGTALNIAASSMDYETTRRAVVRLLGESGLQHLITDDLNRPSPVQPPLKYGDRIKVVISFTSSGKPYPKGATGQIVQATDPAQAKAFAEADEHVIRFDDGSLVLVPTIHLEHLDAGTAGRPTT